MNNMLMKMMLGQLQVRNPQMASQINQAMQNGVNPKNLMKQMLGKSNNEQIQQVMTQAKQFGCPDEVLNQLQNLK